MTLKVVWTTKFKRDYKRAMKRGLDIDRLDGVWPLGAALRGIMAE